MKFEPNFLENIKYAHFFLATPSKRIKGVITNVSNRNYHFKLRECSQITFTVYDLDNTTFYKELAFLMKVYIEDIGWFIISEEPEEQYDYKTGERYKAITLLSSEYELQNRYLIDFIFNTGEDIAINDCPIWTDDGTENILTYALEKAPQWSINYVHPSLTSRKPALSYDSRDIYGFLNDELAKTLNCIPVFDTNRNTISLYPLGENADDTLDTFGENTNIYISKQNILNTFGTTCANDDGIITYINVYGADDLNIMDANCGFKYLCDFTYYYPLMEENTKNAWIAYQEKLDANRTIYSDAIIALSDAQERKTHLTSTMKPDDYDAAVEAEDWTQFSLNELKNNFQSAYQERKNAAEEAMAKYEVDSYEYNTFKEQADEAKRILDAINAEIAVRESQIADQQAIIDDAQATLDDLRKNLSWESNLSTNQIEELSSYIRESDFTDETYLVTSIYTNTDIINEKSELREAALDKLSAISRPQWQINTSASNIFEIPDLESWKGYFIPGNYMTVITSDEFNQKLRLIEISCSDDIQDFEICFSNMTINRKGLNDLDYLLQNASGSTGSVSSRRSGSGGSGDGDYVTAEQLKQALYNYSLSGGTSTSGFTPQEIEILNQLVGGKFTSLSGDYLKVKELAAEVAKIDKLEANSAFIKYLNTQYLVAQQGDFKELSAKVAQIDSLLAGTVSTELAHVINLTAQNVKIDEAVIRDLIAAHITVAMLQAGDISADTFHIVSDDGGLEIAGNTMQFKDQNDTVRIQIGRDANNQFTFCLYDETGKGVLIDSQGIKPSAISDGLIVNDMLAKGSISKDKLNFSIVEADENGNIDAGKVVVNGNGLDVEFTTIQSDVKTVQSDVNKLDEKIESSATYTLYIETPNGNKMTPSGLILNAHLFKNSNEITNEYDDSYFIWTRHSSDSYGDSYWNDQHSTGTKMLIVTANDVYKDATFQCKFETEQIVAVSVN